MQGGSDSGAYVPAEDTFLLEDGIRGEAGYAALDIGSGSGYIARTLARSFRMVVGTDINHTALKDQAYHTPNMICCMGADALCCMFDLIVCNMPYLATDHIVDAATDGGPGGIPVPLGIIKSAIPRMGPGSRFLFVTSSLSDHAGLLEAVRAQGLSAEIISRKKLFFEELFLVRAQRLAP